MNRRIALCGLAGSGKSTVAAILHERFHFTEVALADPLKKICGEVFGFTHEQLYGPSECRNRADPRWTRPDGSALTPRHALQTLGTEWGRNCDPDLWIKVLLNRVGTGRLGPRIVVTDLRFINEARTLASQGFEIWRIRRSKFGALDALEHASEREIWALEMDTLVTVDLVNTGTLAQLEETVATVYLGK